MAGKAARVVKEPGGALLIGLGMTADDLQKALDTLYPHHASLTVLADATNQAAAKKADELWVYAPLGLRGFMALIRRISWRHFEAVYQPEPAPVWLKYLIWPRPPWHGTIDAQRLA